MGKTKRKKRVLEKCPHCGTRLKQELMERHKNFECMKRPVECTLECGEIFCYDDEEGMRLHQENDCYHRFVPCENECGIENVMFKDIDKHQDHECPKREITCCNKPCHVKILACDQAKHNEECLYVMKECTLGCGKSLYASDMQVHVEKRCSKRTVLCKWGCGTKFVAENAKAWKEHEEELCENRDVRCPYKCRTNGLKCKMLEKHKAKCDWRPEKCTYKCGFTGPFCRLEEHAQTGCPVVFPKGTRFSVTYKSCLQTRFYGTVLGAVYGKGKRYRVQWDPLPEDQVPHTLALQGTESVRYADSVLAMYPLKKGSHKLCILGENFDIKRLSKKMFQPLEGTLISEPQREELEELTFNQITERLEEKKAKLMKVAAAKARASS